MRGLILAGGKISRFGSNKALAAYKGMTFLERAVSLLKSLDLKPVVVTRRGMDYPFVKCTTIYDKLPEKGPLGGIYTAMSVFKNTAFLVLTCDMPGLTHGVLQKLLDQHEPSRPLTSYSASGSTEQPFPGVYEASLFGIIKEKIKKEDLSMRGLLEAAAARKMIQWEGDPAVFRNVNYVDQLNCLTS